MKSYMLPAFWRSVRRLVVFCFGLLGVFLTIRKVYPELRGFLPVYLAAFLTYVIGAYFVLPVFLRSIRVIFRPNHIPKYTTTPDGFACDPVNIALVGTEDEVIYSMTKAGWYIADKKNIRNLARQIACYLTKKPYPNAPFSSLMLFGRRQDIGFQLPIGDSRAKRHHVRFWACHYDVKNNFLDHVYFWRKAFLHKPSKERLLWVGAATKDVGLGLISHNLQITHAIDPDTNAERDLIVKTLRKARVLQSERKVSSGKPYQMRNRVRRIMMDVDGEISLCELKKLK